MVQLCGQSLRVSEPDLCGFGRRGRRLSRLAFSGVGCGCGQVRPVDYAGTGTASVDDCPEASEGIILH